MTSFCGQEREGEEEAHLVRDLEALSAGLPHQIRAGQRPCIHKQAHSYHTCRSAASAKQKTNMLSALRGSAMAASREKGTGTGTGAAAGPLSSPSPGAGPCSGEEEAATAERRGRTETAWKGSRRGRAPAAGWWVGVGIRSEEEEAAAMVVRYGGMALVDWWTELRRLVTARRRRLVNLTRGGVEGGRAHLPLPCWFSGRTHWLVFGDSGIISSLFI